MKKGDIKGMKEEGNKKYVVNFILKEQNIFLSAFSRLIGDD